MSEQNNNPGNDGTFNIFGDGLLDLGSAPMPDPFAAPVNTPASNPEATQIPPAAPMEYAAPAQSASVQQAVLVQPVTAAPPVQIVPPAQNTANTEPQNPLAAAVAQAEEKQAAVTADALFSKPPVFEYAGASENVEDTAVTFEQLRIEKATDFPELDDSKRVTWTMEYCTIVKTVPTPTKTVIGDLKKEIENSKAFLDALKKAKDKNPVCKVKPKITAQSKGIAGYKGIFCTLEEAEASDKHICILPARDGNVYEMRRTEAGRFIARAQDVKELSDIRAGFTPALPLVPFGLFAQVLAFFRYFMRDGCENEVMVYVFWDKEDKEYRIKVPVQKVGKAHISVVIPPDEVIDAERYVHVADIHSHNSMPAFFSGTDDRDELVTRVYIVVGCLNQATPSISARICVGGRFVPIDVKLIVDIPSMQNTFPLDPDTIIPIQRFDYADTAAFPLEWISTVHIENGPACHDGNQGFHADGNSFRYSCLQRLLKRLGLRKDGE